MSVISNSLRLRGYDPRPAAVLAAAQHRTWTRVKDAAYLAVVAGLAIGVAASVIGVNRWLDANAVPVALQASALDEPAKLWQVAAGEQVLVTFTNDAEVLYVCTLPGAPKVELNPRPGQEQSSRFSLADPGRYTLSCAPLEQTAAASGDQDGAGSGMGGTPAMPRRDLRGQVGARRQRGSRSGLRRASDHVA